MKITFYHLPLCPRCHSTRKILLELIEEHKDVEIEEINILLHPVKTLSDGIRIVPALRAGTKILDGFVLGSKRVQEFLDLIAK